MNKVNTILVTGAAGFIGFHLVNKLAKLGFQVIGLDNLNNYYDVKLKLDRLEHAGIDNKKVAYNEPVTSSKFPNYTFVQLGIEDAANLERLFGKYSFNKVCHLAAQAGVRYSIKHPEAYIQSNVVGFFNILESSRHHKIDHLVFASSSSVYGNSHETPFTEQAKTDNPISFYAATKKSNELMAHCYSHLFGMKCTGLRFFTVYGPWGRPDMAYSLFTKAILNGEPINVFNNGLLSRDFTYIDDIVEGITRVMNKKKSENRTFSSDINKDILSPYYKIYNIGNSQPTQLLDFISTIEKELEIIAIKTFLPMQAGDVNTTYADISSLEKDFDYKPITSIQEGIAKYVEWYLNYNQNRRK